MHGYERCREDFGVDHHELHVRLYAIKRKNEGRVLEPRKQAIEAQVSGGMVYERIKHEAASTYAISFWSFREAFAILVILIHHVHHVRTKCWFDDLDACWNVCVQDLPFNRQDGCKL